MVGEGRMVGLYRNYQGKPLLYMCNHRVKREAVDWDSLVSWKLSVLTLFSREGHVGLRTWALE